MNEQTRCSARWVDIRQLLVVVPQAELQTLTGPMAGGEQGLGFSDGCSSCWWTFLITHSSGSDLTQLWRRQTDFASGFSIECNVFTYLQDPLTSVPPLCMIRNRFLY